tara:strand:- start:171 stop:434 length:264 start_codon:yes stop_codon:yes gene_type:complete
LEDLYNALIVVVVDYFQACLPIDCYISQLKCVSFEVVIYVKAFESSGELQSVVEDAQCVGGPNIGCEDAEEALEGSWVSYGSVEGLV